MNKKKEFKYYYIYMTKNLINGKCYIGWHATNRLYDAYIGSGHYFENAVKKYGKHNFVNGILEFCNDSNFMEKEKYWIDKFGTLVPNGYNLTKGGQGCIGYNHTEENMKKFKNKKISNEHREIVRKRQIGNKNRLGQTVTEDVRIKISNTLLIKGKDKRDRIPELYNSGKTYKEISFILGCAFKIISKVLKQNNIKGRNWSDYGEGKLSESAKNKLSIINLKKSESRWNEIKELYIEGNSTKKICKMLRCSPNTVTKVIKKFNLTRNGTKI